MPTEPRPPLRVLLVEDNPGDARLVEEALRHSGFPVGRAGSLAEACQRAALGGVDAILTDLGLPDSRGLETLSALHQRFPAIPVLVLTGSNDESVGVAAVQQGAQDYLIKDQLDGRSLARALRYAVERKRLEAERERLVGELREALAKVKMLRGLLPICAWCKKVRDDQGYWTELEAYVVANTDVEITHGMCAECLTRHFPAGEEAAEGSSPVPGTTPEPGWGTQGSGSGSVPE